MTPEDEVEPAPDASPGSLEYAASLAQRILDLRDEIAAREAELGSLEGKVLPELMATIGLSQFRLADGSTVTLGTTVKASLPKDRAVEAFMWLDANGHGDVIKHEVTLAFGRDEAQAAARAVDLLRAEFPKAKLTDKEAVHPGTLTALVKEQLAAGAELPLDLLGVMQLHGVTVKRPRAKKAEDEL